MGPEAEDLGPLVEAYKEQLGRASHLDRMALLLAIIPRSPVVTGSQLSPKES